jgi:hypothetical protein
VVPLDVMLPDRCGRHYLRVRHIAKHAIDFWMTTEGLPHPTNRVTVDRQGRIHVAKIYHNLEPHKRLLAKLKQLMGPLGCMSRDPQLVDPRPADPAGGERASVRHRPLRHRGDELALDPRPPARAARRPCRCDRLTREQKLARALA